MEVNVELLVNLRREDAEILVKSILPEVKSMKSKRSKITVKAGEEGVKTEIQSRDIVAARAAVNTLIRLLYASHRSLEVVRNDR